MIWFYVPCIGVYINHAYKYPPNVCFCCCVFLFLLPETLCSQTGFTGVSSDKCRISHTVSVITLQSYRCAHVCPHAVLSCSKITPPDAIKAQKGLFEALK